VCHKSKGKKLIGIMLLNVLLGYDFMNFCKYRQRKMLYGVVEKLMPFALRKLQVH